MYLLNTKLQEFSSKAKDASGTFFALPLPFYTRFPPCNALYNPPYKPVVKSLMQYQMKNHTWVKISDCKHCIHCTGTWNFSWQAWLKAEHILSKMSKRFKFCTSWFSVSCNMGKFTSQEGLGKKCNCTALSSCTCFQSLTCYFTSVLGWWWWRQLWWWFW